MVSSKENVSRSKNEREISSPTNFRRYSLTGDGVFKFSAQEFGGFANLGFVEQDENKTDFKNEATGNKELESEYDPFDHVDVKHPTTFWGTIFHLIFLSAGTPVLLIPSKFVHAGFLYGTVTMLLIFLFYVYCMRMTLWAAYEVCKIKRVSCLTFSNLVYETFNLGPPFVQPLASISRRLVSCIFIFGWYGTCVLIYVLMVQNLQTICSSWLKIDFSWQDMVLIVFIPVLLLNLIPSLRFLEPCSTLGFFCNFVSILLVLYYSLTDRTAWNIQNQNGTWDAVPLFIGTVFFNINVTGIVISLQYEMKRPKKFEAPIGVMNTSYTIIFALFFIFSLFLALKYGAAMPNNAIDIIPSNLVSSLIANIFYVLGHFMLIPLTMYVPLEIIWNDIFRGRHKLYGNKLLLEYLLRVFLVFLAAFLTYIRPNISFFMSLTGLITSSIDSIIFPTILESIIEWKVGKRGKRTVIVLVKNLFLFTMGFCLVLSGIYNCVESV